MFYLDIKYFFELVLSLIQYIFIMASIRIFLFFMNIIKSLFITLYFIWDIKTHNPSHIPLNLHFKKIKYNIFCKSLKKKKDESLDAYYSSKIDL